MRKRITQQAVFEAAEAVIAAGRFPKLSDIRLALGNKGSQTTLHKYFTQWKLKRFQKPDNEDSIQDLLNEKQLLGKAFSQQKVQIERYCNELIQAEKSLIQLKEQNQQLREELSNTQLSLKKMTDIKTSFEQLYQELKLERDTVFEKVTAEKNQLIAELQEELRSINQRALEEIKTVSCEGHDALMLEKVHLINSQEKNIRLTEQVNQLTKELLKHKVETLRNFKK